MTCNLCGNNDDLRSSHIIPEFFYKPLYDSKHRFNVIPLCADDRKRFEQKGLREKLLCYNCEQQISRYEDHVRRVFYGGTEIEIKNGNPIIIRGIDYQLFKLFQLSLLYRASISHLDFFQDVSLGPHERKVRDMIRSENPGKYLDYPCLVLLLIMENKKMSDGLIYPPQELRIEGHYAYRFILGGCFWIFYVSSHTTKIKDPKYFLSESGEISIPIKKAEDTHFFKMLAENIAQTN